MLAFDDALSRVLDMVTPLGPETLPIGMQCVGRYLAEPAEARLTQPPFNASSMDGYAVRASESVGGAKLVVIGASQAGTGYDGVVAAGQCVRIFTGAPVPPETDAVIMQEEAVRDGDLVSFTEAARVGQNIRFVGQDFAEGKELLGVGQVLTPAAIALAAAAGNSTMTVHKKPKLAMLATGDELVLPGTALKPGQIVASNGYGLSGLFAPFCETVADLGIAKDQKEILTASLRAALESDADVIITSGGASVGDHDLVQPALKDLGVDIDFWKIAMRPGKPLMFGKFGNKLIFGLPGNPVSAMLTATLLVVPALKALAGSGDPFNCMLRLPLAGALGANGVRRHFMRAHLVTTDSGTSVLPVSQTDSAHLSSLATAQALIVHPENAAPLEVGDAVDVILLPI